MCFSPKISLATALVEFAVSFFLIFRYKLNFFVKLLAIFIAVLGLYQFAEYMMCTTGYVDLWGRFGFIAYTLLPAMGLHFVLRFSRKKFSYYLLYIPTLIFIATAIFVEEFMLVGFCADYFVVMRNVFVTSGNFDYLKYVYMGYYSIYILLSILFLVPGLINADSRPKRVLYMMAIGALVVSAGAAFVFIVVLPDFKVMFPSIYCEFSLIFAFIGLVAARLASKSDLK